MPKRTYHKYRTTSMKRIKLLVRQAEEAGAWFKVCEYHKDYGGPDMEAVVDADVLIENYLENDHWCKNPSFSISWCGDGFVGGGVLLDTKKPCRHVMVMILDLPIDFGKRFIPKEG